MVVQPANMTELISLYMKGYDEEGKWKLVLCLEEFNNSVYKRKTGQ